MSDRPTNKQTDIRSTGSSHLQQTDLCFFLCDFPRAPGHVPEVEEGVDGEEEVHGGDGDVVDDEVGQAANLVGMQDASQEEGQEY